LHDREGSTIVLKKSDDDFITIRSKLIIDCTGHETSLVLKDSRIKSIPCGYQIAYGALVTVDETNVDNLNQMGPYDKEAMTLFDYRTDHFDKEEPSVQRKAFSSPTFMYAMPLKENRVFFEETSLVARPALSFQECKDRFFTRMRHLGITIKDIEEEEYCYIPMGGPLPEKDQRVIAFGGATAMSHPSTGYTLCRNMMSAVTVATAIRSGLLQGNPPDLDQLAAKAYHTIWTPSNIRQRNFAVFGGEFLMKQNVEGLRGFFDGFFRLPLNMWAGFLAGWPGLPNNEAHESWLARIIFGVTFLSKLPFPIAADMISSIITYSVTEGAPLLQSVTPFFGEPESYEYKERPKIQGDVAAKSEAKKMILESKIKMDVPVDFTAPTNTAATVESPPVLMP
jgi:lycopene beta-cyclase